MANCTFGHLGPGLLFTRGRQGAEEGLFFMQSQQFLCCSMPSVSHLPLMADAKESPIAGVLTSLPFSISQTQHSPERCFDNGTFKHKGPAVAAGAAASRHSHSSLPLGLPESASSRCVGLHVWFSHLGFLRQSKGHNSQWHHLAFPSTSRVIRWLANHPGLQRCFTSLRNH